MDKEDVQYIKKLVKERLSVLPPDVSFSVGNYGDFSPQDLIDEIDKNSEVGKAAIEMQINFIKKMPKLVSYPK